MNALGGIAVLVLAAGNSSRMGKPKQLLDLGGVPMLEHTVACARGASLEKIWVVLGAGADEIQHAIPHLEAKIIKCPTWRLGMGSSLKFGLTCILEQKNVTGVLVLVCDQPGLSAKHISELVNVFIQGNATAVGSFYANRIGVPAIFNPGLFQAILKMEDLHGAGKLLNELGLQVASIPFPLGEFDVDTPEDYQKFLKNPRKEH